MNIYEMTFSPTGGTKKIADFLAAELNREIRCIDLSNSNEDFHQFSLTNEDTVIVAVPSYSGRVLPRLQNALQRFRAMAQKQF